MVADRSGTLKRRTVHVPETPYGGPAHDETRLDVTYRVKVKCICRCADPPRRPAVSSPRPAATPAPTLPLPFPFPLLPFPWF